MVVVTDDTLREGMQSPGLMFSRREREEIANGLIMAGINSLTVSYAPAHQSEVEFTKYLVNVAPNAQIMSLGRAIPEDVDVVASTGAGISIGMPFDGSTGGAISAIKHAKDRYPERTLRISLTDVGSRKTDEMIQLAKEFDRLGVDRIGLPDTTGKASPSKYREVVRAVKQNVSAEIEVHCHNDQGLAVANTIAGIEAGADEADTAVFGLGERNGIADLATIVSYLEREGTEKSSVQAHRLADVYSFVSQIVEKKVGIKLLTGMSPVFGSYLSVHTAGTHATNVQKFSGVYSVNIYCGKRLIEKILSTYEMNLTEDQLRKVVMMVKDKSAETGLALTYEDVRSIASSLKTATKQ